MYAKYKAENQVCRYNLLLQPTETIVNGKNYTQVDFETELMHLYHREKKLNSLRECFRHVHMQQAPVEHITQLSSADSEEKQENV